MKNNSNSMAEKTSWLLLAYGKEQSYRGHFGYSDIYDKVYHYDSFVPNHQQISEGDLVVVRDKEKLLGLGQITEIKTKEGVKNRNRCPFCNTTKIKRRTTKLPQYRCTKGHEFDNPVFSNDSCTKYSADYGNTFINAKGLLDRHQLADACLNHNQQLAMQKINIKKIEQLLTSKIGQINSILNLDTHSQRSKTDEYEPTQEDMREVTQRDVKIRKGQDKFRKELIKKYNNQCVITGCQVIEVLEAAHISPYRGEKDNVPSNGLLLRADIHKLFDSNLIGINPETFTIYVHEDIIQTEYGKLEGKKTLINLTNQVNIPSLRLKWQNFNLSKNI